MFIDINVYVVYISYMFIDINMYDIYTTYTHIKIRPCHQFKLEPLIKTRKIASVIIRAIPSLRSTLLDTSILFVSPIPITAKIETAGITIPLKIALPAVVPMPPEKPDASARTNKKNSDVKTSGIELATAFIEAPLTPSDKFLPMYSEAVMNPSPARQITTHANAIKINGIKMPISCT